jgi:hypothetical protein
MLCLCWPEAPSSLKENLRATNCLSSCWGRALDCGLQFIDDLDGHYASSDRVDSRERGEYGANDCRERSANGDGNRRGGGINV